MPAHVAENHFSKLEHLVTEASSDSIEEGGGFAETFHQDNSSTASNERRPTEKLALTLWSLNVGSHWFCSFVCIYVLCLSLQFSTNEDADSKMVPLSHMNWVIFFSVGTCAQNKLGLTIGEIWITRKLFGVFGSLESSSSAAYMPAPSLWLCLFVSAVDMGLNRKLRKLDL